LGQERWIIGPLWNGVAISNSQTWKSKHMATLTSGNKIEFYTDDANNALPWDFFYAGKEILPLDWNDPAHPGQLLSEIIVASGNCKFKVTIN